MKTDNELRTIIANRLRKCREEKGLTQTDLGIILDKKKTTISTWERGSSMPDVATLYRLSVYYQKTLEYFYGDSEK